MISREKKIALYSAMVKYRAIAAHTQGKVPASWQLAPGLEATVAAVTTDLKRVDAFFTAGSKLASSFVAGARFKDLLAAPGLKAAHARNGHIPSSALATDLAIVGPDPPLCDGSRVLTIN